MRQARCSCCVFSSTQAAADVRCPSLLSSRSQGRYVFSQKTSKPPKPLLEGGWTLFWGGKKQPGGHLYSLPPLRSDCFTQTVVSPQKCPALARHHYPGSSTGSMPTGSARTRQVVLHPALSPSAAPSCPPALVQHAPNETAADVPLISMYSRLEPKANGILHPAVARQLGGSPRISICGFPACIAGLRAALCFQNHPGAFPEGFPPALGSSLALALLKVPSRQHCCLQESITLAWWDFFFFMYFGGSHKME